MSKWDCIFRLDGKEYRFKADVDMDEWFDTNPEYLTLYRVPESLVIKGPISRMYAQICAMWPYDACTGTIENKMERYDFRSMTLNRLQADDQDDQIVFWNLVWKVRGMTLLEK